MRPLICLKNLRSWCPSLDLSGYISHQKSSGPEAQSLPQVVERVHYVTHLVEMWVTSHQAGRRRRQRARAPGARAQSLSASARSASLAPSGPGVASRCVMSPDQNDLSVVRQLGNHIADAFLHILLPSLAAI